MIQGKVYFSQFGEDVVASRLLRNIRSGFYVDVGAYHPVRHSNTAGFHLQGWQGINVEPSAENFKAFKQFRPHATNLQVAVHNDLDKVELHLFGSGQMNTAADDLSATRLEKRDDYRGSELVPAMTLNDIFSNVVPEDVHVNYFSIDVEGYDFQALSEFDFDRFRPDVICAEATVEDMDLADLVDSPIVHLLKDHGYDARAVTGLSVTFMRSEFGKIAPSMSKRK